MTKAQRKKYYSAYYYVAENGNQISEEFDKYERAEEYAIFLSEMPEYKNKVLDIEIVHATPRIRNGKVLTLEEATEV